MRTRLLRKRFFSNFIIPESNWKNPVRVTLAGSSGAISYSMLFQIANGYMLGPDQPIILNLLDIEKSLKKWKGLKWSSKIVIFPFCLRLTTHRMPKLHLRTQTLLFSLARLQEGRIYCLEFINLKTMLLFFLNWVML